MKLPVISAFAIPTWKFDPAAVLIEGENSRACSSCEVFAAEIRPAKSPWTDASAFDQFGPQGRIRHRMHSALGEVHFPRAGACTDARSASVPPAKQFSDCPWG